MIQHSPEDRNHKHSRNITRSSGKNEHLLAFKSLQTEDHREQKVNN
jgi:hypothetical protein